MIVFSDLHLRESSADVVLGEVLPGLRSACVERGITDAACLGDVLHFRYRIEARILNALLDELRQWGERGITLRILPGNHDQYQVDGRNALEVFNELPRVEVYSTPTRDQWGYWAPYRKDPASIQQALSLLEGFDVPDKRTPRVLFAHLPIQGAVMNDRKVDETGVSHGWLDSWQIVLCGHYHMRQQVRSGCWYVGSPYQTRADESGQVKGYAVWHPGDLRSSDAGIEFVDTQWGPRYHRLTVQAGQPVDLQSVAPRDDVRVKVQGRGAEKDAERVYQQLRLAGVAGPVAVTPELEHAEARLAVSDGAGLADYVRAYVGNHAGDLPQADLLRVFSELTGVQL